MNGEEIVKVLYQDHHTLLLNKPPGVVIHPTYKHVGDTLWDALLPYLARQGGDAWLPPPVVDDPAWAQAPLDIQVMLREKKQARLQKEEGLMPRPCLLHRLDRDTSGVVALARTEKARTAMVRQFEQRTIQKRYLALVSRGAPEWIFPPTPALYITHAGQSLSQLDLFAYTTADQLCLEGPIARDSEDRRRSVITADGQLARTFIRVCAVENGVALLDIRPVTGRFHQIRVHLAAAGYAIIGDQTYAPERPETAHIAASRQFLHAYALEFALYPSGAQHRVYAPLPADMRQWLHRYRPVLEQQTEQLSSGSK